MTDAFMKRRLMDLSHNDDNPSTPDENSLDEHDNQLEKIDEDIRDLERSEKKQ